MFEYERDGDTIRELRADSEVFDDASVDSLRGVFVTIDHPRDFLRVDSWKDDAVGVVSHVDASSPPYVRGTLKVWDSEAIHMIESGRIAEVSCGYECIPVPTEDAGADVMQSSIRYNHAAIGPKGWSRLGTKLRLDSRGDEILTEANMTDESKGLEELRAHVDESIGKVLARLDALDKPEHQKNIAKTPIVKKVDKAPSRDTIDSMIAERTDAALKLELEARDSYAAFFPSDHIEPVRCARTLCEAVLQTVDSEREFTGEEDIVSLSREAALLARKERQDSSRREAAELNIEDQFGSSDFHTGGDSLRAHMFGSNS